MALTLVEVYGVVVDAPSPLYPPCSLHLAVTLYFVSRSMFCEDCESTSDMPCTWVGISETITFVPDMRGFYDMTPTPSPAR